MAGVNMESLRETLKDLQHERVVVCHPDHLAKVEDAIGHLPHVKVNANRYVPLTSIYIVNPQTLLWDGDAVYMAGSE